MQLLGCICQLGLNSNFFVQQGNMLIARLRWELHHWHLKKILLSWFIDLSSLLDFVGVLLFWQMKSLMS